MNTIFRTTFIFFIISYMGCHELINQPDITPPFAPRGLNAIGGDRLVEIFWEANPESDLAGYNIYSSFSPTGKYQFIGTTKRSYFLDDGTQNGKTYYYAVSAYDNQGNESPLSREIAFSTPRPEGYDVDLKDYRTNPGSAGYDFSTYSIGRYDDKYTDIFFEYYGGTFYMDVWNDTEIQDFGYTNSISDITQAPLNGWSPTKDVRLIIGHTYIVRTWDYHYAKIRIVLLSATNVVFDWAYQLQPDNLQLKIGNLSERRQLILGAGASKR